MDLVLPTPAMVERLHDLVFNPSELPGRAPDKSLEGALARVENRLACGLIEDVYDLATACCVAIAQGDCFNDAKRRTAFLAMDACMVLNGQRRRWNTEEVGQIIIRVAQRRLEEAALSDWLRDRG